MSRHGYTLFELLLVLTVLAIVAGLAWPAVLRFSGDQALLDAAERVRSELDRTRFRAIDTGLTYQFRFEPNGRRFIAVPAERELAPPTTGFGSLPEPRRVPVLSGQLGEGLTFRPSPLMPIAPESIAAEWLTGLPEPGVLQGTQWSPPILYRTDGTGTTALFRIADEKRRFVELSVRELTGMAAAGPVRREGGR